MDQVAKTTSVRVAVAQTRLIAQEPLVSLMTSPNVKRSKAAVVAEEAPAKRIPTQVSTAAATLRAVAIMTVIGSGIWYLLWKIVVHLWNSR
jgi:hypothetical protein